MPLPRSTAGEDQRRRRVLTRACCARALVLLGGSPSPKGGRQLFIYYSEALVAPGTVLSGCTMSGRLIIGGLNAFQPARLYGVAR